MFLRSARLVRSAAFGLALVGALLVSGCSSDGAAVDANGNGQNRYVAGKGSSQTFSPATRTAAPKITGTMLDGDSFRLSQLRGDVVVLNFWASWCAPCRLEAPELEKTYQKNKSDGVRFVGVNIRDDKDKARAFEKSFGVTYPSLHDAPGKIAISFRDVPPSTIPATIVIDRKGRIAAVFREAVLHAELNRVVRDVATEARGAR